MLCCQDFEALTPNLLARTIETVEGGGLVIMLLSNLTSLTQLYTLTMDVHSRLRTEAHQEVTGREGNMLLGAYNPPTPTHINNHPTLVGVWGVSVGLCGVWSVVVWGWVFGSIGLRPYCIAPIGTRSTRRNVCFEPR